MGFLLGEGSLGYSRRLVLARIRVDDGLMGTREASRMGAARVKVIGPCCLAVASTNAREIFEAGLMSIFSFVERKGDLVPIGGGQGG